MPLINDVLIQTGLDEKAASVYTALLNGGESSVLDIAKRSGLKRTNIYNILEDLKEKNLVTEVTNGKTAKYFPNSPKEIEKLIELKSTMIRHAKLNYEILINSLLSQYKLNEHKPLINFYEGLDGLKKLYDDINTTGEDFLLIRSTYEDDSREIDELSAKQIVEQVKRNMHVKVIGPVGNLEETKALYTKYDKPRLVEERYIKNFPFDLPAQIIIYGTKIAISAIRNEIVITIIDNKEISDTFRIIFDFIWTYATPEHNEVVKDWVVD